MNATGIIGISIFVFGYIFFAWVRLFLLYYLEERARHLSVLGFLSYRSVYYDEKKLKNL